MEERFKFRAWDPRDKEWRTDFTIEPEGGEICDQYGCSGNRDGLIVMQCTGVKDKAGKLIFEGDLLRSPDWPGGHGISVVRFGPYDNGERYEDRDAGCGFYLERYFFGRDGKRDSRPLRGLDFKSYPLTEGVIIIGSIYENPELLETKK